MTSTFPDICKKANVFQCRKEHISQGKPRAYIPSAYLRKKKVDKVIYDISYEHLSDSPGDDNQLLTPDRSGFRPGD